MKVEGNKTDFYKPDVFDKVGKKKLLRKYVRTTSTLVSKKHSLFDEYILKVMVNTNNKDCINAIVSSVQSNFSI